MTPIPTARCPTCNALSPPGTKVFPFCSPRCHMADLGRWLNEDYRIPAEPADPSELPPPESDDR